MHWPKSMRKFLPPWGFEPNKIDNSMEVRHYEGNLYRIKMLEDIDIVMILPKTRNYVVNDVITHTNALYKI